jgi:acyl carrier protein
MEVPTVTHNEIETKAREFIINNFVFDPHYQLGSEESLLDNGILDSTGVLEVIMWLESTFDISVEDSEVLPENLDSTGNMTRYVISKLRTLDGELALAS